jgi:K+-sensing histidine kinase KdpD
MLLKNAKDWNNSGLLVRYIGAVFVTSLALGTRLALHPYIEPYLPFQLFFLSTFVVSLLWGVGPGILSLVLGLTSGFYFFIQPYDSFATPSNGDLWVFITYATTSLVMQLLIEYTRRLMYSSELLLKVADSNYRISLHNENEKIHLSRKFKSHLKTVDEFEEKLDQILFILSYDHSIQYLRQAQYYFDSKLIGSLSEDWSTIFSSNDLKQINEAKETAQNLNGLPSTFAFRFNNEDLSRPSRLGEFKQIKIGSRPILICSIKN